MGCTHTACVEVAVPEHGRSHAPLPTAILSSLLPFRFHAPVTADAPPPAAKAPPPSSTNAGTTTKSNVNPSSLNPEVDNAFVHSALLSLMRDHASTVLPRMVSEYMIGSMIESPEISKGRSEDSFRGTGAGNVLPPTRVMSEPTVGKQGSKAMVSEGGTPTRSANPLSATTTPPAAAVGGAPGTSGAPANSSPPSSCPPSPAHRSVQDDHAHATEPRTSHTDYRSVMDPLSQLPYVSPALASAVSAGADRARLSSGEAGSTNASSLALVASKRHPSPTRSLKSFPHRTTGSQWSSFGAGAGAAPAGGVSHGHARTSVSSRGGIGLGIGSIGSGGGVSAGWGGSSAWSPSVGAGGAGRSRASLGSSRHGMGDGTLVPQHSSRQTIFHQDESMVRCTRESWNF